MPTYYTIDGSLIDGITASSTFSISKKSRTGVKLAMDRMRFGSLKFVGVEVVYNEQLPKRLRRKWRGRTRSPERMKTFKQCKHAKHLSIRTCCVGTAPLLVIGKNIEEQGRDHRIIQTNGYLTTAPTALWALWGDNASWVSPPWTSSVNLASCAIVVTTTSKSDPDSDCLRIRSTYRLLPTTP
jgi:hypothetical protein